MADSFQDRFTWQQQYIPAVVQTVAPFLIHVSTPAVDRQEAGDLMLSFPRNGTIAVRLRTPEAAKFAGDITLRSRTRNNMPSEVTKIVEGKADFYFYGHVNEQEEIWHWYFLDCNKMRAEFIRRPDILRKAFGRQIQNPDGTQFIAINVERDLKRAVIHHENALLSKRAA